MKFTEKFFDLVCHTKENATYPEPYVIKGAKGSDGDITLSPKAQHALIRKKVQAFMMTVGVELKEEDGSKKIQAFMGSSDLPKLTKDVFNNTHEVPNYDLLWQEAFRGVQLTKGQLAWEISTTQSSIAFKLIPEGGKVEFYESTGTKIIVEVQKYGAGVGVTWETVEGRKLYKFIQSMEDTRAALYTLWANIHYGLLATAGATNPITWQGVVTQSQIDRDIQTLNKGYEDLGEAVKDKGFGDTANVEMLLYAKPKLKSRIMKALRATDREKTASSSGVAAVAGDTGQTVDNFITPKFSHNGQIPANKALLVLPGHKIQNSMYLKELGLSKQDMESLNELRSYWTAFGAVVAETDQVYELAFA